MLYCGMSGRNNSGHVAALLHRLTEAERSVRKSFSRSLLQVHTLKYHTSSLMERRCCNSAFHPRGNRLSPRSKNTLALDEIMASGEQNKMCSCGVGSISEADPEKRQMRWQARREETWGQLNPQNWHNVIHRHYCTEGLQKHFSIAELTWLQEMSVINTLHVFKSCWTLSPVFGFIWWKHEWIYKTQHGRVCGLS